MVTSASVPSVAPGSRVEAAAASGYRAVPPIAETAGSQETARPPGTATVAGQGRNMLVLQQHQVGLGQVDKVIDVKIRYQDRFCPKLSRRRSHNYAWELRQNRRLN